ncbi:type II toxin-antitoxin system HicA family toxin [Flavobacterium sp. KACC 22763]|uniref:type II toxin-antitoxin system HicA family toxin n=1 Tax=Flavobacterium sp. KACC 22763 TaxID=3025668 RepID=UPI002365A21F|nr:type II toxin-antitoxin system HicA family toxin [Flavobacterium sp. KACC 22763]WDF66624.1 type II toxin-antitoxin system HicA family toxin [Flavobacterium sp. KACC 22763]
MSSEDLFKILRTNGWELSRTNGSHHIFKRPGEKGIVVVPHPRKDIPKGTLNSILKQAGLI